MVRSQLSSHRPVSRRSFLAMQGGAGLVEYIVLTSAVVASLVIPFGVDNRNAVQRVVSAVQAEHAGYRYLAGLPSLPRGTTLPEALAMAGGSVPGQGPVPGGPAPGPGGNGSGQPGGPNAGHGGPDNTGGGTPGPLPSGGGGNGAGHGTDTGNLPAPGHTAPGPDPGLQPPGFQPPGTSLVPDGPDLGAPAQCEVAGADATPGMSPNPGFGLGTGSGGGFSVLLGAAQPTWLAATHVGNPIHVVTGNKYQREIDLHLPGLGLAFVRHYNSRSAYRGALGPGWRHSFDTRLQDQGNQIQLWQADGRRIDFQQTRTTPGGGRHFQATQHGDGTLTADAGGYDWHWRDGTHLGFTREGRLQRLYRPDGTALSLAHDKQGRLTGISTAHDHSLRLDYDPQGRLTTVTDPGQQRIHYTYDDTGNLTRTDYPDHSTRHYHYEDPHDPHNLTGISVGAFHSLHPEERSGARASDAEARPDPQLTRISTWAYDAQDRAIASRPADKAQHVELVFGKDRTRVTDATGQASVYRAATQHGVPHVTAIEGPGCSPCSGQRNSPGQAVGQGDVAYRYNERFQITRIDRRQDLSDEYAYDRQGRTLSIHQRATSGERRLIAQYLYADATRNPAVILEPSVAPDRKHAWFLAYDPQGRIIQVTETGWTPDFQGGWLGMERSTRYEYAGEILVAVTGPDGVRQETQPASVAATRIQAQAEKDAYGRVTARRDADGLTRIAYDGRGRMNLIIRKADTRQVQETRLEYDPLGRVIAVTGPRGTARAAYDASGRLASITAPDGRILDLKNLNPDWAEPAAPSPAEHDPAGRLIRLTDPAGVVTTFDHDPFGRLTRIVRAAGTPEAVSETLAYDAQDRLIAVTDPRGNTAAALYDDFGNRLYESTPDAGVTLYRYDEHGRPIASVDEAGTIRQIGYADRQLPAPIPDAAAPKATAIDGAYQPLSGVRRSFDEKGRWQEARSAGQITTQAFDPDGRLAEQVVRLPGVAKPFVTRYGYDAEGRLIRKTLPDGTRLIYAYDDQGRLTGIERSNWIKSAPVIGIAYDEHGLVLTHTGPDGIPARTTYDAQGRLETLDIPGIARKRYEYDARGQLTAITTPDGEALHQYRYDLLGRLIEARTPDGLTTWTYDRNGNRTEQTRNGFTTRYRYSQDSNRLLAMGDELQIADATAHSDSATSMRAAIQQGYHGYHYAPSGQPMLKGDLSYTYTPEGRSKAVYRDQKKLADYAYDDQGQRIRKTMYQESNQKSGTTTHFLYENGRLAAEADDTGKLTAQYLYRDHRPVAVLKGERIYTIHADHRGAPIAVTDAQGQTVWQARYSSFGEASINDDPDGDGQRFTLNLRLPGQYHDIETGTHYNLHRDYDPATGRYLTPDPLGIADGLNTYAYVKNDPVNRIDPTGLYGQDFHYYITYFLAVTAGLDKDTALIIALAAQYIDDNPWTKPTPLGERTGNPLLTQRLERYHFVLDYNNGYGGDSAAVPRRADESDEAYARRRFLGPKSTQLSKLLNAALKGPHCHPNAKAQLFGEYLHALEDTFAHRNWRNEPLAVWNWGGVLGHARYLHAPDQTHNHISTTVTVGGPIGLRPERIAWNYNELRTLAAQREVYHQITEHFDAEIKTALNNKTGKRIEWAELAGHAQAGAAALRGADIGQRDGCTAFITTGCLDPVFQAAEREGILQRVNRDSRFDEKNPHDVGGKLWLLNWFLRNEGFDHALEIDPDIESRDSSPGRTSMTMPTYRIGGTDQPGAADNRERFLGDLLPGSLDGVILPQDDRCTLEGLPPGRSTVRGYRCG